MPTKKQLENLKKGQSKQYRSGDEAARNGKKGGKASGQSRRIKKTFSEIAKDLGSCTITEGSVLEQFKAYGVDSKEGLALSTATVAGQYIAGIKGNTNAAQWVKDLAEPENESKEEEYPAVKITAEMICGVFCDINRHISAGKVKEAIIKGGRGGAKSSYPGLKIPEIIMANPYVHALVLRQVKDTLRDSVFEQIKWGIEILGVSDRFKCTTSPLLITYLPTGQHIYFRGADDPLKIKSIKPPFGYIGILWFEEFDQYDGPEAIRNIKQSALRGTDQNGESKSIIFETYNPPPTVQAWVNRYTSDIESRMGSAEEKEGTEVLTTSYKDVPVEWLGESFLSEAADLKKINPIAYRNEYLGEVTGTGGKVFRNLTIREITDAEIEQFDVIKQGLDWGWFPDPNAFIRLYYDYKKKKLYLYAEERRNETSNEEMLTILAPYRDEWIIADSSEDKSIRFFNENGYRMTAAEKPPGSVEYGIKWLCSMSEIVIDRRRCPNAAREFEEYEYKKDKNGEYIAAYPDSNNHFIDATRYAMNREIEDHHYAVKGGIGSVANRRR